MSILGFISEYLLNARKILERLLWSTALVQTDGKTTDWTENVDSSPIPQIVIKYIENGKRYGNAEVLEARAPEEERRGGREDRRRGVHEAKADFGQEQAPHGAEEELDHREDAEDPGALLLGHAFLVCLYMG